MNRIARYCLPLVVAGGFAPAAAQDISSAYTKLDIRRDCRRQPGKAVEDYGDWRCKGYAGMPMWLGAGDQRMYVSFGSKTKEEPAAEQTLAPFNDFYKGIVEWRLVNGRPFATIMRWNVKRVADMENREVRGRALVVTRLPPSATSATSMRSPTQTPTHWRARSLTNTPATSPAARTGRSSSARSRQARSSSARRHRALLRSHGTM